MKHIKEEITGRLERWSVQKVEDGCIIWGYLYEDRKGRFPNGTYLHTSFINKAVFKEGKVVQFKEGEVVQTLNSRYLLGDRLSNVVSKKAKINNKKEELLEKLYV